MSLTVISSLESARRKFFINWTYIMSRNQRSTFLGSGGRNESNNHQLVGIGDKKIFHQLDVNHVKKVGIKRFLLQEAEVSLTTIRSLESARSKFFINSTYIMFRKQESNVFRLRSRNESNSQKLARIGEMTIFHQPRSTLFLESRNQTFLGSGGRNESNSEKLDRIGRRKFFINWTYIMSRNQESTFLGSGGRNESNNHLLARIGEKKIFHQPDVHHVQRVRIKRFSAQEAEMSLTAKSSLESAR